jgi:hypothetical protein
MFIFTFELICMLLEGYLKNFPLTDFFWVFKNIEIFGFLVHPQPLRRQFFSACSACVGNFLAEAQPALANF